MFFIKSIISLYLTIKLLIFDLVVPTSHWYFGTFNDSYRIGPFEVESALIEHPAVLESAVVSSPDGARGEVSSGIKRCLVLMGRQTLC